MIIIRIFCISLSGKIKIVSKKSGFADDSSLEFLADGGGTLYTRIAANSYRFGKGNHHHISGSVTTGFFVKKGTSESDILLHVRNNLFTTGKAGMHFSGSISGSEILSSGDVVAFNTSDKRLKDNITTIDNPIYKLKQLKGVEFDWKNEYKNN